MGRGKHLSRGRLVLVGHSGRTGAAMAGAALFACAGALSSPCVAQVYKWVDEKGVTQYSEKPPPGTKAQAIGTPAPKGSAAEDRKGPPEIKTWQQQELEFRQRQIEAEERRQKQEAADAGARREAAMQRESCIGARRDLTALQEQRPVYQIDEKGEKRYLQDKDRAETIKRAQLFIEKNCPK